MYKTSHQWLLQYFKSMYNLIIKNYVDYKRSVECSY